MKKIIFFISFLLLHGYFCSGQADRAEMIKMGFIVKELGLSPQEAQKFWPLYNNYVADTKLARATHANDVLAGDEVVLNIKKKYRPEFKKVLQDDERVNKTFTMEQQFREIMRKEYFKRQRARKFGP